MLKAVVFDFDGVIVDSEPLHYEAFVSVAREFGLDFSYDEYARMYIGYDDRDAFRAMLVEAGNRDADEKRISDLGQQKHEVFVHAVERGVRVFPGVRSLIENVSASMPMAIASGATRRDIDLILRAVGFDDAFECIISADDVRHSKPDPESYILAVGDLKRRHPDRNITAADCLALEDTEAGIRSARDAGLWTIGVAHASESPPLPLAHRVVPSLDGLNIHTLRAWHARAFQIQS